MAKTKMSVCDSYRRNMVGILGELGKEESLLDSSRKEPSPSPAELRRQLSLAKSIALNRKSLALLFFEYLLEDEYD